MMKYPTKNLFKLFLPSLLLITPLAYATKGVEGTFGKSYFHMGLFSLYTLSGKELKSRAKNKGFVSTKMGFKSDSKKSTSLIDISGEVGRFINEDERFSFSITSRAIVGKTETSSNNRNKKLNVRDLVMGIRFKVTTWLSKAYKLSGSFAYFRSPKILSFGDFEHLEGFHAEVSTPIIAASDVYINYEKISGETTKTATKKTVNIVNSIALGVRFAF